MNFAEAKEVNKYRRVGIQMHGPSCGDFIQWYDVRQLSDKKAYTSAHKEAVYVLDNSPAELHFTFTDVHGKKWQAVFQEVT